MLSQQCLYRPLTLVGNISSPREPQLGSRLPVMNRTSQPPGGDGSWAQREKRGGRQLGTAPSPPAARDRCPVLARSLSSLRLFFIGFIQ